MNAMKKIIWALFAWTIILSACNPTEEKTEQESFAPDALINVKAEPGIGEITFSWTNPVYYSFAELTYVNSDGLDVKVVIRDKSVDATAGGGVTTYTLTGFTDTNTYTFTLTPYGPTFEAGPSTVIQCAPDTDIPGALTDVSVERKDNQLVFRWTNPLRYNYAIIEYTDTENTNVKLTVTSDSVDPVLGEGHTQYIISGFFDIESTVFMITPYGFTNKPGPSHSVVVAPIAVSPESPVVGWFLNKDGSITKVRQESGDKQSFAVIAYVGSVEKYFNHFIALALTDCSTTGEEGTGEYKMSLTDAVANVGKYAANHPVTINGTTYNTASGTSVYDTVERTNSTSSVTRTADAEIGWRLPSVTDFRYAMQGLTSANEADKQFNATEPVGIAPNVPNNIKSNEGDVVAAAIKAACGSDPATKLYWVSSLDGTKPTTHAWYYRIDMHGWYLITQTSTAPGARPVFAY